MREIPFRPQAGSSPFAVYGLVGFAISLIVHLGTFFSSYVTSDHPLFWILHLGIFPLFFAMIWSLKKGENYQEDEEETPLSKQPSWFNQDESEVNVMSVVRPLPRWARVLALTIFAYVFVNFVFSFLHLPQNGADTTILGQPLNTEDVPRYSARAFSGHWLVFYLLPTLHFLYKPRSVPHS